MNSQSDALCAPHAAAWNSNIPARKPFSRRVSFAGSDPNPRLGSRWADLLRRVYDIDMRTCPNCGQGRLEPIATILDPDVIARILAAMDRFARAPPA
ncbi:MAG: hypothetical protein ACKO51_00450 [Alphaproteobacteria bacterium]